MGWVLNRMSLRCAVLFFILLSPDVVAQDLETNASTKAKDHHSSTAAPDIAIAEVEAGELEITVTQMHTEYHNTLHQFHHIIFTKASASEEASNSAPVCHADPKVIEDDPGESLPCQDATWREVVTPHCNVSILKHLGMNRSSQLLLRL